MQRARVFKLEKNCRPKRMKKLLSPRRSALSARKATFQLISCSRCRPSARTPSWAFAATDQWSCSVDDGRLQL